MNFLPKPSIHQAPWRFLLLKNIAIVAVFLPAIMQAETVGLFFDKTEPQVKPAIFTALAAQGESLKTSLGQQAYRPLITGLHLEKP
jgi:hypothetical protein